MKRRIGIVIAILTASAWAGFDGRPASLSTTMAAQAAGGRVFELRTYTVRAEGPGSLDLLHTRFRERTIPIFKRLGFDVVGFWQPVSKPDTLIYLLAFKDAATRDALWAKFVADPEWVKTRTEMQVGAQITNEFMIASDYGPMK